MTETTGKRKSRSDLEISKENEIDMPIDITESLDNTSSESRREVNSLVETGRNSAASGVDHDVIVTSELNNEDASSDEEIEDEEFTAELEDVIEEEKEEVRNKNKRIKSSHTDSDEDDFDPLALMNKEVVDPVSRITPATAIFKIASNDLSTEDAIKFATLFGRLNSKARMALQQVEAKTKGVNYGDVDPSEDPSYFFQLKNRLILSVKSLITNRADLLMYLKMHSPKFSYKDSTYYFNETPIYSIIGRSYMGKFYFENISKCLSVDVSSYVEHSTFSYLLYLCSNGNFKLVNGIVTYEPQSVQSSDKVVFSEFTLPPNVVASRNAVLNNANKQIKRKCLTSISAESLLRNLRPPKNFSGYISSFRSHIGKHYTGISSNKSVVKDVMKFSSSNKTWRSAVNSDKFLPTPEFDYCHKGLNFYAKKKRISLLGYREYQRSKTLDDAGVAYDITGFNISQVVIKRFKSVHVMFAPNLIFPKALPKTSGYSFLPQQRHSLNVLVTPNDKEYDFKTLVKQWIAVGHEAYIGEVEYMACMMTGDFMMSGPREADIEFEGDDIVRDNAIESIEDYID
jgi:hypothetical protein